QELCTRVMYHRPSDPNAFLLEVLDTLRTARDSMVPTAFFTAEDIEATFGMMDPTGKGSVSRQQYEQALRNVGVEKPAVALPEGEQERVCRSTFQRCMQEELAAASV
ncbi:hypothetical protein JKP88DRAFT_150124, partial [Tribonema minus]